MIKLQITNTNRGGAGTRLEAVFQADDDPALTPELYLELVAGLEELGQRLGGLSWRVSATPWATYRGDGRQVDEIKAEVSALAGQGKAAGRKLRAPAAAAAADEDEDEDDEPTKKKGAHGDKAKK